MTVKMKIRRGDQVMVIAGKDKGRRGEIIRVIPEKSRVVVAGANMVKKHQKQSGGRESGIYSKEASLHISNVAAIDPSTDGISRIARRPNKDGKLERYFVKSGEVVTNG